MREDKIKSKKVIDNTNRIELTSFIVLQYGKKGLIIRIKDCYGCEQSLAITNKEKEALIELLTK
jgi:hypothetical protein